MEIQQEVLQRMLQVAIWRSIETQQLVGHLVLYHNLLPIYQELIELLIMDRYQLQTKGRIRWKLFAQQKPELFSLLIMVVP